MIERFVEKFRVKRDECGDPYIPCAGQRGDFVYEIGPKHLGVWIHTSQPNKTFNTINRKWGCVDCPQMGEDELIIRYPISGDMKTDCRFLRSVKAIKRRRLSPERREQEAERLREFRFRPAPPRACEAENPTIGHRADG